MRAALMCSAERALVGPMQRPIRASSLNPHSRIRSSCRARLISMSSVLTTPFVLSAASNEVSAKTSPATVCFTATNFDHVQSGRAYDQFFWGDRRPPHPRIKRRQLTRQRGQRRIRDLPKRSQRMIRPDPRLQVHVTEKAAANLVVAAHSNPPTPSHGITRRKIANPIFNSLLILLSHKIRDRVFAYVVIARCGNWARLFPDGGRNGLRIE